MLEVTAAIINNEKGQILICQRPAGKFCELLWEFPGGKLEENETLEQCLIRECKEELDIELIILSRFTETTYEYSELIVHITFFKTSIIGGKIINKEHNDIKWVYPSQLNNYNFCPADKEIVKILHYT